MKNFSSSLLIAAMLSGAANSFASQIISGTTDDSLAQQVERVKLFSNEEFFSKADYIIEVKERNVKWQSNDSPCSGNSVNHKQSKKLIDRFNMLRAMDNLESIEQDTILDNISKILLTNKTYKNSAGVYNEDSVRSLLYRNGIIDYQYEIQEVSDKDTATVFNSFLLADKFDYIRMGYYSNGNRHILLKTKSYLKFNHWLITCHSDPINGLENETSAKAYTDSVICYLKVLKPDEYYYQFYNRMPLNIDNNVEKKKVQITPGISRFGEYVGEYDFGIKATGKEIYMFLIISNKNNEGVAMFFKEE